MSLKYSWVIFLTASALLSLGCRHPTTPSDTVISLLSIPGVAVPETGEAPVTSIDSPQYAATLSWSPADPVFAIFTVYTATITLTPKAGYTLSGVAADGFSVEGATAANSAHSGEVTAVFPPTSLNMVSVPAGRFQRDGTETNISVISQPYRMSRYEITRSLFLEIMGTDPSIPSYCSGMSDPVQKISWYRAIAFCNKLSLKEGLEPVYAVSGVDFGSLAFDQIPENDDANWNEVAADWTRNGYRLPTEMEWMWAAMGAPADGQGGSTNTTGYQKDFAGSTGSNAIDDYAWIDGTGQPLSHPAGSKLPNELDIYDMSGNAWEWCWDAYSFYPTGTLTDYRKDSSATQRIARGGGVNNSESYGAIAYRDITVYSSACYSDMGFRVVRR